jgi:hypothetical protein
MSIEARTGTTVRGHMNIFPKDVVKGPGGESFNPHPRSVVYPSAPICRRDGDRRAPLRAVEFDLADDEFFTVVRTGRDSRNGTVSVGSFTSYADAYTAMVDGPRGHRSEIRLMVPTRTEVLATGPDGEQVVIGESLTWQPQPIADRLRLSERD